jgi:DNA-binding NtrC family response regulator
MGCSTSPAASRPASILIVEDDEALAQLFASIASQRGHAVTSVHTLADGKARVDAGQIDLVFTDLRLPDGDGLELIEHTRRADPRVAIIAVTAFGSIELAVRAVRLGAYDFLTKPVEPAVMTVAMDRRRAPSSARAVRWPTSWRWSAAWPTRRPRCS